MPYTEALAKRLSLDSPCSTAYSPLVSAINSSATESTTKFHVWLSSPKVNRLSHGANASVMPTPAKPNHSDQRFTAATIREMLKAPCSPFSQACEMSRTLLWRTPRLVAVLSISRAWLKMPNKPTPTGPIQIATNLLLTMEHKMPITCTPPKMPIAFIAMRDMEFCDAIAIIKKETETAR